MEVKILKSDFNISESSLGEFLRILLPDKSIKGIEVTTLSEDIYIVLEIKNQEKKIEMKYKNISEKFEDQKVVMFKSGMLKFFEKENMWGSLTGVRPVKLIRRFFDKGFEIKEIEDIMREVYLVKKEKIELLFDVFKTESKYLNKEYINIYIGIPYCPTKCTYCSFASYEKKGKYKEKYSLFVEKLKEEIQITGKSLKKLGKKIESIYIGGGTPTILEAKELHDVLGEIRDNLELKYLKEFTLEAGRIDTISEEKLLTAKENGITRISINPQTFNKKTLDKLNRFYDEETFKKIYEKAREAGFIINMDLIIGLPGETTEDILFTLDKVKEYLPENLTVHYLALKRASVLNKDKYEIDKIEYDVINEKMKELLFDLKLKPYYMYRQKNSVDEGENTGYSLEGKESIFNIEMIEENQNTIGLGGGAITKIIKNNDIIRIVNPKDPISYVDEFEERLKNKIEKIEKELW